MKDGETRSFLLRCHHWLEYAVVLVVSGIVRVLPREAALRLGAGIGRLGWALGIRRGQVLRNLGVAFPAFDAEQCRDLGRRAAINFGRTVVEFLRFGGGDRDRVLEFVELEGLAALRESMAHGRGAVLITGHLGAWALYVTALAACGVPASLLVGKQTNPRTDRLIQGIPGDRIRFISKGKSSPRQIIQAVRDRRLIVTVADHYSSEQQLRVPFMGRPAYTLPLPGALVQKHGLPVFLMTGHRIDEGRHEANIEPLGLPRSVAGHEFRVQVATTFNAALARRILEQPDQYFWYHDRWKHRELKRRRAGTAETPNRG